MWDAEIIQHGVKDGRYYWVVDVSTAISVRAGTKGLTARSRVRLIIHRVPVTENPAGIAIQNFTAN